MAHVVTGGVVVCGPYLSPEYHREQGVNRDEQDDQLLTDDKRRGEISVEGKRSYKVNIRS